MTDTVTGSATKDQQTLRTPVTTSGGAVQPGERGATSIADSVVAKIASLAVREVEGVAGVGGALSGAMGQVVGRIRGREHATQGVGVEVGTSQAAIDLTLRVSYPVPIPQVTSQVRENVIDRVETLTGLEVVEVNIAVIGLEFPGEETEEEPAPPEPARVA
ncbi:MAG: Asp23/Gls24 family envelope stress response protein [Egibacteraceae bacterium]